MQGDRQLVLLVYSSLWDFSWGVLSAFGPDFNDCYLRLLTAVVMVCNLCVWRERWECVSPRRIVVDGSEDGCSNHCHPECAFTV